MRTHSLLYLPTPHQGVCRTRLYLLANPLVQGTSSIKTGWASFITASPYTNLLGSGWDKKGKNTWKSADVDSNHTNSYVMSQDVPCVQGTFCGGKAFLQFIVNGVNTPSSRRMKRAVALLMQRNESTTGCIANAIIIKQ